MSKGVCEMKKTLKRKQKNFTQEKFVNYMYNLQKRQGGITLIALVITIIVNYDKIIIFF